MYDLAIFFYYNGSGFDGIPDRERKVVWSMPSVGRMELMFIRGLMEEAEFWLWLFESHFTSDSKVISQTTTVEIMLADRQTYLVPVKKL